ncbi:Histone acetyltransferase KAT8 [Trichinella zimbabwensis]|uniref:histone acetyltransferase n=1 Tax=Trichinella zimbabwensis TaxID=268475 RepID=A0A0V1H476_9BILA|nr:Histone acetyltransferase KAT8 [Trichinella zimbabwensis]
MHWYTLISSIVMEEKSISQNRGRDESEALLLQKKLDYDVSLPALNAVYYVTRSNGEKRRGKVLSIRSASSTVSGLECYVHYLRESSRMDEWVSLDRIGELYGMSRTTGMTDSLGLKTRSKLKHDTLNGDISSCEEDNDERENSMVRNIDYIQMGNFRIKAWYSSRYPLEYCEKLLFICDRCAKYMLLAKSLKEHMKKCSQRPLPGKQVYRKDNLVVIEVDGDKNKLYCQFLALLGKLFIYHKAVCFLVQEFFFYVLYELDEENGYHMAGFYSKEKNSECNNLACISVFPQYQKKSYGLFLIQLSYAISTRIGIPAGPERPLSDLGKRAYRSYFAWVIIQMFGKNVGQFITLDEIVHKTAIRLEDIQETLQEMNITYYYGGRHGVFVSEELLAKCVSSPGFHEPKLKLDPLCLTFIDVTFMVIGERDGRLYSFAEITRFFLQILYSIRYCFFRKCVKKDWKVFIAKLTSKFLHIGRVCSARCASRFRNKGCVEKILISRCLPSFPVCSVSYRHLRTDSSLESSDILDLLNETNSDITDSEVLESFELCNVFDDDSFFGFQWYSQLLNFVQSTLDVPWWIAIAITATLLRLAMFPIISVPNQRMHAEFHNATPEMVAHHRKIAQARKKIDLKSILKAETDYAEYCASRNLPTIGSQLPNIILSVFVFSTQFFALKHIAAKHCVGFETGGVYFFENLTDQSALLALITSFTYFTWMFIRMEQTTNISDKGTVTNTVGRIMVATLSFGSLFIFASMPAATLCFCTVDFAINTALASLYWTRWYRDVFGISHPIIFLNSEHEAFADMPLQLSEGVQSARGKIRAVRRANISRLRRDSRAFLVYDPDEFSEKFKRWFRKLIGRKENFKQSQCVMVGSLPVL